MVKKDKDTLLDKKTKEQFKQEIMEEINTKYKDEICSAIVEDVKNSIDDEYKVELKNQITNEIEADIKKDIAKEQRKLYRSKNWKIVRLYFYLLLLLAAACYMIYCLYKSGNFDILKNRGLTTTSTTTVEVSTTTTSFVKDFNWYLKEYGNLLNNIKITDYSMVQGNVVISDLPVESRLTLAYQTLSKDSISVDGIINTIEEGKMIEAYKSLFGTEDGYRAANFVINDLNYAYSSNNQTFIAINKDSKEATAITNKIVDIKENGDYVIITAVIAVVTDGKVYNVDDLIEPVGDYADLARYSDRLTKVDYEFKKMNDSYYITGIVKR